MNIHTRRSDLVAFHVFQLIFNISNVPTANDDDDENEDDSDGKLRYVCDKKDAIFNYMCDLLYPFSILLCSNAMCHIPRNFPFVFEDFLSRYGIS